eukprot:4704977-Pleurochrysis_carterae.AAC.2
MCLGFVCFSPAASLAPPLNLCEAWRRMPCTCRQVTQFYENHLLKRRKSICWRELRAVSTKSERNLEIRHGLGHRQG